jgi:cell division protein ZapA (FtsZ GTPase activity inhibitor)
MQEIELKIGNTTVKLSCEDPKKILDLAAALNDRVEKLKKENNLSDVKALFINSIYLMDEIESINQELQKLKVNFYDKFENEREKLIKNYEVIIDKIEEVTEQLVS